MISLLSWYFMIANLQETYLIQGCRLGDYVFTL
jgi:hypothetical protein